MGKIKPRPAAELNRDAALCNPPRSRKTQPAGLPALLERDIEKACSDLLELDSWRPLKTDPVSRREWGKGFGELGMADRLYIRYLDGAEIHVPSETGRTRVVLKRPAAEVLWVEFKRPRKKLEPHQDTWHRDERLRGALTLKAGVDFPATVDGFMIWYRKSGLMRRPI